MSADLVLRGGTVVTGFDLDAPESTALAVREGHALGHALAAATLGAAHPSHEQDRRGRLAVGMRADLGWLPADPREVPAARWPALAVRGTWCGARRTYGDGWDVVA